MSQESKRRSTRLKKNPSSVDYAKFFKLPNNNTQKHKSIPTGKIASEVIEIMETSSEDEVLQNSEEEVLAMGREEHESSDTNDVESDSNTDTLRPFFLPEPGFMHTYDDETLPEILLTDPEDKVQRTKAFKQLLEIFHKHHDGWNTPNISFTNTTLTKEIKKYINIIQDANVDFTIDLPLHLYNYNLMSTRNKNLPGFEFAAWPLPTDELITPRNYLNTTNFESLGDEAKSHNREMNRTKFTKVNYVENHKLIAPKPTMTCFWHPKIDPKLELDECLDAIFERKINRQIEDHATRLRDSFKREVTVQRKDAVDLILDPILKRNVYEKLDQVIDRMVDDYIDAEVIAEPLHKKMTDPKGYKPNVPTYGMDWLGVMGCLDNEDEKFKTILNNLFKLKLSKDTVNGPTDRYPAEFENYTRADAYKQKVMKSMINKHSKLKSKKSKTKGVSNSSLRSALGQFLKLASEE